jgi:hypothetical protein
VLVDSGHYHKGGYAKHGKQHFVTVQAIVEAPTGIEAHAFVHVYEDRIAIEGHGFVESRLLDISEPKVAQLALIVS